MSAKCGVIVGRYVLLSRVIFHGTKEARGNMMDQHPNSGEREIPILELKDVRKTYTLTKTESVRAVDGLSLSLKKGEFVTLIGPSGCGKSTTLRLIAGFLKANSGEIMMEGKSIKNLGPEERNIPMVFQNYALFPHMTVFENIAYGLEAKRIPSDTVAHDVAMMCQMLNLVGTEKRYPNELSDGQQQRVALARALVLKPKIILFDEPLSNLDARLRIQTRYEIKRMQQLLGITVLYVTHDQSEALSIPDRVLVMSQGRIVQEGRPRYLYDHPKTPFVADFIASANFFDAFVLSVTEETITLSMQELEFAVPIERWGEGSPTEGRVLVAINPIAISINAFEGECGVNQSVGVVRSSLFTGQSYEYQVSFGVETIRVMNPNLLGKISEFVVGTPVVLTFHPASFNLYRMEDVPR